MAKLIKNYLPLRVSLPSPTIPSATEETFLFVKEHIATGSFSSSESRTLFIANAPFYPNVRTSIILQSLFERYGDVEKVVVKSHPRKTIDEEGNNGEGAEDLTVSMFKKEISSMGTEQNDGMTFNEFSWYDQGKFAHIIFTSSKTMKKVWSVLNGNKKNAKNSSSIIKFGKLEMQELEDLSYNLYQKEKEQFKKRSNDESDDGNNSNTEDESDDDEKPQQGRTRGLAALLQAKKESIPSRETLKKACDRIMGKYEEAEEESRQRQLTEKNQPDDDGFVTVSYDTNVGDVVDLEKNGTLGSTGAAGGRRRKEALSRARSARTNVVKGSSELKDFYRFQLKDSKKRGAEELKSRFQEDLKRVKKMKEDKMYRPF